MSHGLIAAESERLLIDAVAGGDVAAVDELYRAHSEHVIRFIFRRVEEQLEDAEEITLDTFASAINLAGGYDGSSSVAATGLPPKDQTIGYCVSILEENEAK